MRRPQGACVRSQVRRGSDADQRAQLTVERLRLIQVRGVAGIRQLWRRINRNNWKDLVADAQKALSESVAQGSARLRFTPGFSMLFVGDGDRTACNLVVDNPTIGPTIATKRPAYTSLWSHFDPAEGDEGFARVLERINADEAGEYQLFPVVDEHLFLPGPHEYDTPPPFTFHFATHIES